MAPLIISFLSLFLSSSICFNFFALFHLEIQSFEGCSHQGIVFESLGGQAATRMTSVLWFGAQRGNGVNSSPFIPDPRNGRPRRGNGTLVWTERGVVRHWHQWTFIIRHKDSKGEEEVLRSDHNYHNYLFRVVLRDSIPITVLRLHITFTALLRI